MTDTAAAFLDLHRGERILVLPNAWDVATARVLETAGARAIGTTSMGIAASLGYPDGQRIPFAEMLEAIRAIANAVRIPVTADLEAGYGETTEAIVERVLEVVDAGAVGINIEDTTGDPNRPLLAAEAMAERVAAIREGLAKRSPSFVINARTDVYLIDCVAPDARVAEATGRGNRYRQAGADCVFVPGGLDRATIETLVREIDAPLNVLANPAISRPVAPAVAELERLGVRRVSVGSGLMRATLAFLSHAANELLESGTYQAMQRELERPEAVPAYRAAIGDAESRENR